MRYLLLIGHDEQGGKKLSETEHQELFAAYADGATSFARSVWHSGRRLLWRSSSRSCWIPPSPTIRSCRACAPTIWPSSVVWRKQDWKSNAPQRSHKMLASAACCSHVAQLTLAPKLHRGT